MTFLHRLAHRIARLKSPFLVLTAVTLACSQGERSDFLSPVPNKPSSNIQLVRISPKIAAIQAGAEFRFTAVALNSSGSMVPATLDWTAESGTVSSNGSYVGLVPGPIRVMVRAHDRPELVDTAVIAVWQNETDPTGLSIQPADIVMEEGDTLTFSAFLNLANGVQAAGATVDWNTTGGDVNASGLFTAPSAPGEYLIAATTSNGYTGSAKVTVRRRSALAASVLISPRTATVSPNQGVQFSATTMYSDGKSGPGVYLWSTSLGTITQAGAFRAASELGTAQVKVNLVGTAFTDSAEVTVLSQAPTLVTLRVTPDPTSVQAGGVQQFFVSGTWSNGTTAQPTVTWTSTGGSISASGTYNAGSLGGTYMVIAQQQGGTLADTAVVTVQPPAVIALAINPKYASVMPGGSQQFTASATWSNGSTVLPALTWSATGGTVSGNGQFTAGATPGTYRVVVSGGGRTDTATVSVGAPRTLVSLSLTPESGQASTGGTIQFTPWALWSDGSSTLPALSWTATGGTVSSSGVYTAGSTTGSYRVIVNGGGKADTSAVTVTTTGGSPTPPQSLVLTISPKTIPLSLGEGQYFVVAARWADGSTAVPLLNWTASEGTVSSFLGGGYYSPPNKQGTFRVIVSANGAADTAAVTVAGGTSAPVTLTALNLTPASANVAPGASQMFTVAAVWSDGSSTLPAITWSATGGTINQTGLYTAGSTPGTFRVIASGGGKADTSAVTVGAAAVVTQLSISPRNVSLGLGQTQQFTTSATWSDGVSRSVSVTYSATGGLISVGGLFTAGQLVGTFSVIANCTCGRADTATVALSNLAQLPATLTSLSVSPGSTSLFTGGTQQFNVSALWSDGTTTLPTRTWTATGGTIDQSGFYSAGGNTGTYRVVVSGGGRADTATVSLTALPVQGTLDAFLNSGEPGCDGSDSNVLLCDDFESGFWYTVDGDQVYSTGGGLAAQKGWFGTIYANPITPAGAARPGEGVGGSVAATHGVVSGGAGGGNMAEHGLRQSVSEVWVRFYTKPKAGHMFGNEKTLSVNKTTGGGIYWGLLTMNQGGAGPYPYGALSWQGMIGPSVPGNFQLGNAGRWYRIVLHLKLNSTPAASDGVVEIYADDAGTDGRSVPSTPTLRGSNYSYQWAYVAGEKIGALWWENWANPGSTGERLLDNIKVSKIGPP